MTELENNKDCCLQNNKKIILNILIILFVLCLFLGLVSLKYYYDKNYLYLIEPKEMPSVDKIFTYEILEEPLKNFYINTSHNSYLANNQIFGRSREQNTLGILYTGARCIELDIISDKNNTPIVSHDGWDVYKSTFESHCKVISEFAFKLTNDPLIIYLEIHNADNEIYMINIRNVILKYFEDRLYENRFNNSTKETYLPNVKLKDLLGKICIVINYFNMNIGKQIEGKNYKEGLKNRIEYLDPIVHATTDEPENGWFGDGYIMRGQSSNDKIENVFSKFVRVYPYNVIRSKNFDIEPFIKNGYSLIALNKTSNTTNIDSNLKKYNEFFKKSNIIPKYWIIENNIWKKINL